ncbi:MAG TPA: hypothetical protein VMI54_23065 [Polyangiaceae bacterium]|nr:hypothetical protein [Polyangiaceae bacterium]
MQASSLAPSLLFVLAACGSTDRQPTGQFPQRAPACVPAADAAAPAFSDLYARYFAVGTPGHCAAAHCHGAPGANVWSCGDSAATCYEGMVHAGLVNPADPAHSLLADPQRSPLLWVNPSGDMPFDTSAPDPEARDAILAWVAACAPND